MQDTIHLAQTSKTKTPFALFPKPESVIDNWNDDMASRLLPVAQFSLEFLGGSTQNACFFYYEDMIQSFLNASLLDNGKVHLDDHWRELSPLEEPPDITAIQDYHGAFLAYEKFDISMGVPSDYVENSGWNAVFEQTLIEAGALKPLTRARIGGRFPCYVQGVVDHDDERLMAELPAGFYDLMPSYLYLYFDGKTRFSQEVQWT